MRTIELSFRMAPPSKALSTTKAAQESPALILAPAKFPFPTVTQKTGNEVDVTRTRDGGFGLMSTYYSVCRGDCLSSISSQFGFDAYQAIYYHPENAAFRQKRPNPNVIYEGDVVFIPDPTFQELPC